MKQEVYSNNLQLLAVLDQTVNLAEELRLSEGEIIERLLDRFHMKSDECPSPVDAQKTITKKFFDGKAGP